MMHSAESDGSSTVKSPLPRKQESINNLFGTVLLLSTINIYYEKAISTLWVTMLHPIKPCLTMQLIREFNQLAEMIRVEHGRAVPSPNQPIKFVVLKSGCDKIYNLGGDLDFFIRAIGEHELEALQAYGRAGASACHALAWGFDASIVTVSLVRGLALGGGFEAARCCDIMVAEEDASFQLPEAGFGLFAASGVMSVIAPRIGHAATRRLVIDGEKLDCAAAKAIDLVDEVASPTEGEAKVRSIIARLAPRHAAAVATYRGLSRCSGQTRDALFAEADFWAQAAMNLAPESLTKMRGLSRAQARRFTTEKQGAIACQ